MKKMKSILLVLTIALTSFTATSQKVARVTISTTATQIDALTEWKKAGKQEKYGSKDLDSTTYKVTLFKFIGWKTPQELDIFVVIKKDGKNASLTISMPHVKGLAGNYKKEIRKVVNHLKLPNMLIGAYTDEIE